jgi:hypothetical protein
MKEFERGKKYKITIGQMKETPAHQVPCFSDFFYFLYFSLQFHKIIWHPKVCTN